MPRVEIDNITYLNSMFILNEYKELAEKAIDMDYACHTYFMGTGKKFDMICYKL